MRRMIGWAAVACGVSVGCTQHASGTERAGTVEQPNIIWLMAEDIGQDLSCYGMKGVRTPTLDRLAEQGRVYRNAICANPICSPNRSAMMVGVNPTVIDAHMHRSNRDKPLPEPYKPITRMANASCTI